MDIFNLIQSNLLTPIILFFLFGIIAARIKSDLKIPEAISEFLPIYLLAAIGLHGGIEMRKTGFEEMLIPMLVAIGLSLLFTLNHYQILRRLGKFNIFDSYALASTYGAVGAVTFSVGLSFLKNQGVPSERIINGPALRYANILKKNYINNKNKKNILVPLSQNSDASYEILKGIKTLSQELKQTDYFFIIKPHPNLEISKNLLLSGLKILPKNVIISDKDIDKLLNDCLFTIFMSTAAAYNAVINANIVLSLGSELNFSDNYLDIFEKEFQFVNSYSLDSIKNTLLQFTEDEKKIEKYKDEFGRLKNHLIDGMNAINEVNLDKFIRN